MRNSVKFDLTITSDPFPDTNHEK